MRLLYAIYALAVLSFAAYAQSTGQFITRPTPGRVAPQSVRQNPGGYRPVYRGSYGTFRGK